ncbi:hypothetical protein [Kutzneria sp. NPDC052558]|uniref:hypothetical protein n=1 Tax=Kutzneria sp. NPDC052558 TaxID=3364121 RepID=UPI0037C56C53
MTTTETTAAALQRLLAKPEFRLPAGITPVEREKQAGDLVRRLLAGPVGMTDDLAGIHSADLLPLLSARFNLVTGSLTRRL